MAFFRRHTDRGRSSRRTSASSARPRLRSESLSPWTLGIRSGPQADLFLAGAASASEIPCVAIELLEERQMLTTLTWVGTNGGGDGVDWSDAGNWSGGVVGAIPAGTATIGVVTTEPGVIVSTGYDEGVGSGGSPIPPNPWFGSPNTTFVGDASIAQSSEVDEDAVLFQNNELSIVSLQDVKIGSTDLFKRNGVMSPISIAPGQSVIVAGIDGSEELGSILQNVSYTIDDQTFTFADATTPSAPDGVLSGNIPFLNGVETVPWTQINQAPALATAVTVTAGGGSIANGSTTPSAANETEFSSTQAGATTSEKYTITNNGTSTLTLGTASIGGANAGDFTVTSQPASSVPPGGYTNFTVQFTPTADGNRTATVSFSTQFAPQADGIRTAAVSSGQSGESTSNTFTFTIGGSATGLLNAPIFSVPSQPNVPPPSLNIGPKITQPVVPTADALAVAEIPNVPPARLTALASLFNFDPGSGAGTPNTETPTWLNYGPSEDEPFYQSATMPEQHGHDVVLALALSIVPEVEGAEFSDERPDPQKLPHLAALEIALPELLAPEGELEADATRSWWIAGTAGAALAGSVAALLVPRFVRKRTTRIRLRANPSD